MPSWFSPSWPTSTSPSSGMSESELKPKNVSTHKALQTWHGSKTATDRKRKSLRKRFCRHTGNTNSAALRANRTTSIVVSLFFVRLRCLLGFLPRVVSCVVCLLVLDTATAVGVALSAKLLVCTTTVNVRRIVRHTQAQVVKRGQPVGKSHQSTCRTVQD